MIKAYKNLAGYHELKDNDEKHDAEYVILTVDEYNKMVRDYKNLQEKMRQNEIKYEEEKEDLKESCEQEIERIISEAQEKVDAAESIIPDAEAEAENIINRANRDANKIRRDADQYRTDMEEEISIIKRRDNNLIRITKERSNAARGLKPKKKHNGYLVLQTEQWKDGKNIAWRSVIQTPYPSSIPKKQIYSKIMDEDFWNDEKVFGALGIVSMRKEGYQGKYKSFGTNDEGYEKNGCYNWLFKANHVTGLWEVVIFTTKSITVPEQYRPVAKYV